MGNTRTFIFSILLICACALFCAGQSEAPGAGEREAFSKAMAVSEPAERIHALEQFIKDHPAGKNLGRAYTMLFESTVSIGKANFEYAEKAIAAAPESSRAGVYNSVARALADHDQSLDKAYDYIKQGLDLARKQDAGKRVLGTYLDSMAWIEYKRGDFTAAEKNEREAIASLPKRIDGIANLEYSSRLGRILAKIGCKNQEAAELLANSFLLGESRGGAEQFESLVESLAPSDPHGKKAELFKRVADQYIDTASDKPTARSRVAIGYARNGVYADQALALARQALETLTPKSSVESIIEFNRTLGFVYSYQKSPAEAVSCLQKIAPMVPPYDSEFHQRLGQSLEALGRDGDALEIYLQGAAAGRSPRLTEPLTALYKKVNGSDSGLKERIAKTGDELARFEPKGPPKTSPGGRVVLAELFTGSECAPCIAADMAFDHLKAGYERKAVVLLEYHLHIPNPDPMTNEDTEARAKYYAVTSTPSVLLGGVEKLVGGGAKSAAKNRFELYSYVIDRNLAGKSQACVEVEGFLDKSVLSVKAGASAPGVSGDLRLRVALVEEVVHFKGANNLSEHRAVVRRLIGSQAGIALKDGYASLTEKVDLSALVESLKAYLDKFEQEPPPRFASNKDFKFKEKKHAIDHGNLSLVAFLQDDETKEILQASYFRMSQAVPARSAAR